MNRSRRVDRIPHLILSTIMALPLLSIACGKKPPGTLPVMPSPATTELGETPVAGAAEVELSTQYPFAQTAIEGGALEEPPMSLFLRTVYFEFDRYDLQEDARATLRSIAEWFKAQSTLGVVIEGHCDERGTIEYNLALGQRRAAAVRDYLAWLGVDRSRMNAISYGEEMPADAGHDESAWAKNRRADFNVER